MRFIKVISILSLLFTNSLLLFSQQKYRTDSLWLELKNTSNDTVKICLLRDLAWEIIYTKPDSSIKLLRTANVLSKKSNFVNGRIYSLLGLSRAYWVLGNFPESMNYAISCINLCDSTGNNIEKVKGLNMLGLVYYQMLYEDKAIEYFQKALDLENRLKDSTMLSRILGNLGDINFNKNDTAKAFDYYLKALDISRKRGDDMNSSTNYLAIGLIYRERGELSTAERYLMEGLRLAEKVNDNQNASQALSSLAILYQKAGDKQKSLEFSERALKVAQEVGDLSSVYESAYILYEIYNEKKDFAEALHYYLIADAADDSMFNSYQNDEMNRLQHSFDIQKKQAEIELLSKDKALAELRSVLFGSGFVLLLILGIVVFRSRQKTRRANLLLEKQKNEIEDKNEKLSQKNEEIITQRDEIAAQRDIVINQKAQIEKIYTALTDSIHYAERIQKAVIPDSKTLSEKMGREHFILYRPKDIVSGDFYYADRRKDILLIAVADCTGHGVPGAFMSMLGISFLNEIISKDEIKSPGQVLEELRKYVIRSLQQKNMRETGMASMQNIKDGMDIAFIELNTLTNELRFAGANNPLYIVKNSFSHWTLTPDPTESEANNQKPIANSQLIEVKGDSSSGTSTLVEVKGDKMPVSIHEIMNSFTNHSIKLNKGDIIYLATDGYADQFGGKNGKKFMSKRLKQLLTEISREPIEKQKQTLEKTFENWRKGHDYNFDQTDDITILGIKI